MRYIWKYPINGPGKLTVIQVPAGATVRAFGKDPKIGEYCAWIEVNPENMESPMSFKIVGTGHEIPEEMLSYYGMIQENGFFWHLYGGQE